MTEGGKVQGEPTLEAPKLWQSRLASGSVAILVVLTALGATSGEHGASTDLPPSLCQAVKQWRAEHPEPGLQVIVSDVTFRGAPGDFALGEGLVVAPAAVAMPGVQDVLDVRADPPATRVFTVEGVRVAAWPYVGSLHHEMRFRLVSLVRRAPAKTIEAPAPTFESLPLELRLDATIHAKDTDEHELETCKSFHDWAIATAGEPPFSEQARRLVSALHVRKTTVDRKHAHEVCAQLREGTFSSHQAHVLSVMALREIGVPAYGFIDANGRYLLGAYSDGSGWMTLDIDDDEKAAHGWTLGGAALLSVAPTLARSPSSADGHWTGDGVAIDATGGGPRPKSITRWEPRARPPQDPATKEDTTVTWSAALASVCP